MFDNNRGYVYSQPIGTINYILLIAGDTMFLVETIPLLLLLGVDSILLVSINKKFEELFLFGSGSEITIIYIYTTQINLPEIIYAY